MNAPSRSLKELFLAALEVAPADRAAWLDRECAGDAGLREHLGLMLAAHDAPQSLLDRLAEILPGCQRPDAVGPTINQHFAEGPGSVIGPYKLLEQIGEGGFGVVFMAEQAQPVRRKVALKIIKPGMDTRQVVARFEAERQALALMDHPNIARVLDAGTTSEPEASAKNAARHFAYASGSDSGRPYFVMELVRGTSMTEYCDQNNLPIHERLELFIDASQAVQHAHQKGIIHRDIKPSNVLVTLHDGKPVVKVIDFGIAKAMGQQLTEKTLFTNFAQMIGTPLYMSPEQAEMSAVDADTRSDVYSLGVLLYELLTGTTPFDKERLKTAGFDEIRRIIREEEPPKPSTRMSTVDQAATTASEKRCSDPRKLSRLFRGELDWIVMKALEKDRNRRYETASAFAADVGRYLKDEAVLACPPSVGYRVKKFVRRNKGPVVTACLVIAALVAGIAGTSWGMIDANNAKADAEGQTKKKEIALGQKDEALQEKDGALSKVRKSERQARIDLSMHLLDKGLAECEEGDIGVGMLWLARSLENAPRDAADLQRVIRINLAAWHGQTPHLRAMIPTGVNTEAVFSGDGKNVVAVYRSSADEAKREARVFDFSKGELISAPIGIQQLMNLPCRFSPDRRVAASLCDVGAVQLWDLVNRQAIGRPLVHAENHINEVVFSADSKTLLTCAIRRQITPLPNGGTQVRELPGTSVRLWEATTGAAIGNPITDAGRFGVLALSPDGKMLVTSTGDGALQLRHAATGTPIGLPLRHPDDSNRFSSATFSPDGQVLLTVSWNRINTGAKGKCQFWDATTGKPMGTSFETEPASVTRVDFSPDGRFVLTRGITGQRGGAAQLWYVDDIIGKKSDRYHIGSYGGVLWRDDIQTAAFSPDGRTFLMSGGGKTRMWDLATGSSIGVPILHDSPSLEFHPNGRAFLSAMSRTDLLDVDTVQLWEAPAGAPRPLWTADTICLTQTHAGKGTQYPMHWYRSFALQGKLHSVGLGHAADHAGGMYGETALQTLVFGKDGETILTAFLAAQLLGKKCVFGQVQDSNTGEPSDSVLCVPDGEAVANTPDGKMILTITGTRFLEKGKWKYGKDKMVQLWEAARWEPVGTAQTYQCDGGIWKAAFNRDGTIALLVGENAQLWNLATGAVVGDAWVMPLPRRLLAFSPDGKMALIETAQGAELRDAATGAVLGKPLKHQSQVIAGAFSGDSRKVLTGSKDRTARLWETASTEPLGLALHHEAAVSAAVFSADGRTVVTGSEEGIVRFWDVAAGKLLGPPLQNKTDYGPLNTEQAVSLIAFAPDGLTIVTGTRAGHVRRWPVPPVPLEGSVERIAVWVSTITDRDLDAAGVSGWQAPEKWQKNQRKLAELGGAPVADTDVVAWHRREAESSMRDVFWYAAAWHLDRVIAAEAGHGRHYIDRGRARVGLGQQELAIADFSRAIELGEEGCQIRHSRGRTYAALGKSEEAIADYQTAIRLKPDFCEAHYDLGNALWDKGLRDRAVEAYTAALRCKLDPKTFFSPFPGVNQLAWRLATNPDVRLRDPGRAVTLAKELVERFPKTAEFWTTLGIAHYRAGNWDATVTALDETLKLAPPGRAVELLFLAMAHWQLGHKEEARQWYNRADEWIQKNREALDKEKQNGSRLVDDVRNYRAEAAKLLGLQENK